jgi:hypothetical protein
MKKEEEIAMDPSHSETKKQVLGQKIHSDKHAPQQSSYGYSMPTAC